MIDQVFYRRDQSGGYNEYSSEALSNEEAHNINLFLNNIASQISNLDSGQDTPIFIFPVPDQNKYCIAKISVEFYGGRKNLVQHGLLISKEEYFSKMKDPELIFGFTNKNFISVKPDRRNKMVSLQELTVEKKADFFVNVFVKNYQLNNKGFLQFLNAIYTILSSHSKDYVCGIVMDNPRSHSELLKQFGYLIMCMLPYPLRKKVSFGSTRVPKYTGITVQILNHNEADEADVIYNIDTQEFTCKKYVEVKNFYLDDLVLMSDKELKDHFEFIDYFEHNLEIEKDGNNYMISKLAKLSNQPGLFARENAEDQISFVNNVLELPTTHEDIIIKIVIKLLPFVDTKKHMEAFSINHDLYLKLDQMNLWNPSIVLDIENNLLQNFKESTDDEKVKLFQIVYKSFVSNKRELSLIISLIKESNDNITKKLIKEYIALYNELFDENIGDIICKKIENVFVNGNLELQCNIWDMINKDLQTIPMRRITYDLLYDTNIQFLRTVLSSVLLLYLNTVKEDKVFANRYYQRVMDVLRKENDEYILSILYQLKKNDIEVDNLWLEIYEFIKDKNALVSNAKFKNDLEYKYYNTNNQLLKDLYIEYIFKAPQKDIEMIIHDLHREGCSQKEKKYLFSRIYSMVIDSKMKLSIQAFKEFIQIASIDNNTDNLAEYIRKVYLQNDDEVNNQIFSFLKVEQPYIYESKNLKKEDLSSFDTYMAIILTETDVSSEDKFKEILSEISLMRYHDNTYKKLKNVLISHIGNELSHANSDVKRYEICKKFDIVLQSNKRDGFIKQYSRVIKEYYIDKFWEMSQPKSFDYDNRFIYLSDSIVYSDKIRDHENHVLAERISKMFDGGSVNWLEVYKITLTNDVVQDRNLRIRIGEDFKAEYRDKINDGRDINYIAFKHVDLKSLKMDYQPFFEDLEKKPDQLNCKKIQQMRIFKFLEADRIKKELRNYNNYKSMYPSYSDVHICLFISQIIILLILAVNNYAYKRVLEMLGDVSLRNNYLLLNYGVFLGVIALISIITLYLSGKNSRRKSEYFDNDMYGLLIINLLLTTCADVIGMKIDSVIISIMITVILLIISIVLNLLCRRKIMDIRNNYNQKPAYKRIGR